MHGDVRAPRSLQLQPERVRGRHLRHGERGDKRRAAVRSHRGRASAPARVERLAGEKGCVHTRRREQRHGHVRGRLTGVAHLHQQHGARAARRRGDRELDAPWRGVEHLGARPPGICYNK